MTISTTTIITDTSGTVHATADALYDTFNSALSNHVSAANAKIIEAVTENKCSVSSTLNADGNTIQVDREWSDNDAFTDFRSYLDWSAIEPAMGDAGFIMQYSEA
ncbi:MAG: hypothetical protein CXT73_01075 [Methanobacteriota archaeon]|jgi:hypothetical protein|nr:MAG: hypothetical protein CXT73_01075 [Euryarchaeota archaeon]